MLSFLSKWHQILSSAIYTRDSKDKALSNNDFSVRLWCGKMQNYYVEKLELPSILKVMLSEEENSECMMIEGQIIARTIKPKINDR